MQRRFDVFGRLSLGVIASLVLMLMALAVGSAASGASGSAGVQSVVGVQALVAKLAVLRRPQTAADMLPAGLHLARFPRSGKILPSLTRLVATPPGASLFLVVTTPASGPRSLWSPKLGDQVAIVSVTGATGEESVAIPAADLTDANQLETPPVTGRSASAIANSYQVAIVPDGVARVSWTFANRQLRPGRVVNLAVANNIALNQSSGLLLSARWFTADGAVFPTSDRAYQMAVAARDAVMRAQIIRLDARTSARPSPAILAGFAVFSIHSRTGVRIPGGDVISHPALATVPLPILQLTSGRQPPQLDPEAMRQITTPSGFQTWIIPGHRGMCVALVDKPRIPSLGSGAGEGCSPNIASTLSHGGGISSGYPGGASDSVRILPTNRPIITIRSTNGHRRTIRPAYGIYITHTGPKR